jgi:hypothetical protein
LCVIRNPLILFHHSFGGEPNFLGGPRHSFHLVGLFLRGFRQSVRVSGPRVHLPPLEADKYRGEDRNAKGDLSQSNGRPFKTSHLALYVVELICGCWLCWRAVYWLGYFGRKGHFGFLLLLSGYALAIRHYASSLCLVIPNRAEGPVRNLLSPAGRVILDNEVGEVILEGLDRRRFSTPISSPG